MVSNLDRTTECTQLQSSSRDIQSTSKQASGPQGPLKMAYWTLAQNFRHFSQKNQNTSCYDQLEEAGAEVYFHTKTSGKNKFQYGMVWCGQPITVNVWKPMSLPLTLFWRCDTNTTRYNTLQAF